MSDALDDQEPPGRTTAPQSEFSRDQVLIGALVVLVGVAIAYGLPYLLS